LLILTIYFIDEGWIPCCRK